MHKQMTTYIYIDRRLHRLYIFNCLQFKNYVLNLVDYNLLYFYIFSAIYLKYQPFELDT